MSIRHLTSAMAALGVVLSLDQIRQAAEVWGLLSNRLTLVTENFEQLAEVRLQLYNISQNAYTQLSTTAELYHRIARNADRLNLSQGEMVEVTEAVANAVFLSGVSAETASAGLIQFGQALASGVLRGDELRSVLEQLPRVAEAISEGMGVTLSDLRKMGEQGTLTAEAMLQAILSQADIIEQELGNIEPTIGQGLIRTWNSLVRLVGTMDDFVGATGGVNRLLGATQTSFDNWAGLIDRVGNSIGVMGTEFEGANPAINRIGKAAEAYNNALTALSQAQLEGADNTEALQLKVDKLRESYELLVDRMITGQSLDEVVISDKDLDRVDKFFDLMRTTVSDSEKEISALRGNELDRRITSLDRRREREVRAYQEQLDKILAIETLSFEDRQMIQEESLRVIGMINNTYREREIVATQEFNDKKTAEERRQTEREVAERERRIREMDRLNREQLDLLLDYEEDKRRIEEEDQRRAEELTRERSDFVENLRRERNALFPTFEHEAEAIMRWRDDQKQALEELGLSWEDYGDAVERITQGKLKEARDRDLANARNWEAGVVRAFERMAEESSNYAQTAENAILRMGDSFEDTMTDIILNVHDAGEALENFARIAAAEVTRGAVRTALSPLYERGAGLFGGLFADSIPQIPSFDNGGMNTRPGFFYSGVPEVHIPLDKLKGMNQQSASRPVNVTVNNYYGEGNMGSGSAFPMSQEQAANRQASIISNTMKRNTR